MSSTVHVLMCRSHLSVASPTSRERATRKHSGAPGVSGVNAACAAGSDGWLGSSTKSAPLPGKMEREEGWGAKGTTPASSQPSLFWKALETSQANVIHAGAHDAHCLCSSSSTFTPALHTNPRDPEHSHLTIKTGIRREGARRKGCKERAGLKEQEDNDMERLIN